MPRHSNSTVVMGNKNSHNYELPCNLIGLVGSIPSNQWKFNILSIKHTFNATVNLLNNLLKNFLQVLLSLEHGSPGLTI